MKMRKRRKLRTSKAEIKNRVLLLTRTRLLRQYSLYFKKFEYSVLQTTTGRLPQSPHFWKQS